jgi:hypothetical protein
MQDWEAKATPYMEQITLRWHPMYHIFYDVPLLQNVLLPFPWAHNKEEARILGATICNMLKAKRIWRTSRSTLILKMFMFVRGL